MARYTMIWSIDVLRHVSTISINSSPYRSVVKHISLNIGVGLVFSSISIRMKSVSRYLWYEYCVQPRAIYGWHVGATGISRSRCLCQGGKSMVVALQLYPVYKCQFDGASITVLYLVLNCRGSLFNCLSRRMMLLLTGDLTLHSPWHGVDAGWQ